MRDFDSFAGYGSEIAPMWSNLYGLGPERAPVHKVKNLLHEIATIVPSIHHAV